MTPSVTVVITTFNRSGLLARAIRSVIAQRLDDIEIIVSDNASTDDTAAVVSSFDDPRVDYSPLPTNLGPHANFNRALELGTAPYVALLQDDDLMLPDNLARKVALLDSTPTMSVAHAAFRYIDADDRVIKEWANWARLPVDTIETGPEFIRRCLVGGARVNHSSAVIRRSLSRGEQFDPADGRPCDFGFFLRVARRGEVGYLAEPLTAIRRHADSDTVRAGTMQLGADGYEANFELVRSVQAAKRRFISEHGAEIADRRAVLAGSRAWSRGTLANAVRHRTEPERHLWETVRLLVAASTVEPTMAVSRDALRVIGGSLVGRRGRALYRRHRDRPDS